MYNKVNKFEKNIKDFLTVEDLLKILELKQKILRFFSSIKIFWYSNRQTHSLSFLIRCPLFPAHGRSNPKIIRIQKFCHITCLDVQPAESKAAG